MLSQTDSYYGHDTILAWYCGLRFPRPILARLQHGWNPNSGFGDPHLRSDQQGLTRLLPKLVWNVHNAAFARSAGLSRVEAIGAPFLYLLDLLEGGLPDMVDEEGRCDTLVYPFHHGAESKGARVDVEYVNHLLEREGRDGVTVCLYWRDFDVLDIREIYERAGFVVMSHGRREDPLFLVRQREVLRRHRRVVTNRVSSALWYAGMLGCELEVYGPVSDHQSSARAQSIRLMQRERWPELFEVGGVVPGDARRLAAEELGAGQQREPNELRALLGWSGPPQAVARLALGAVRLRQLFASR